MAPTTRSSLANAMSAGKSTPSALSVTPQTTPRKVHHCTKCKRPRAGHPRQGCPYVDSPIVPAAQTQAQTQEDTAISEALGLLCIGLKDEPRSRRRSSALPAPPPQDSLASLSTDSSEVSNMLAQPGMMRDIDDDDESQIHATFVRWQDTIPTPEPTPMKPSRARISRMPGTLITPTTSFDTTKGSFLSAEAEKQSSAVTRPLGRSMSIDERNAFLAGLVAASKTPPATIYVLPCSDIPSIEQSATKHGFHCRTLAGKSPADDGLLVLGRDGNAVDNLFRSLGEQVRRQGRGVLQAAAEGAVMGAVATWTGLAFS